MWNRNHNSISEEFVFHIYLCAMWISEETKGNITNNEAILISIEIELVPLFNEIQIN